MSMPASKSVSKPLPSHARAERSLWLLAAAQALSPYLLAALTLWWFGG